MRRNYAFSLSSLSSVRRHRLEHCPPQCTGCHVDLVGGHRFGIIFSAECDISQVSPCERGRARPAAQRIPSRFGAPSLRHASCRSPASQCRWRPRKIRQNRRPRLLNQPLWRCQHRETPTSFPSPLPARGLILCFERRQAMYARSQKTRSPRRARTRVHRAACPTPTSAPRASAPEHVLCRRRRDHAFSGVIRHLSGFLLRPTSQEGCQLNLRRCHPRRRCPCARP